MSLVGLGMACLRGLGLRTRVGGLVLRYCRGLDHYLSYFGGFLILLTIVEWAPVLSGRLWIAQF